MAPKTPAPSGPGRATEHQVLLTPEEHAAYERLRRAAAVRHRKARYAGASVLLLVTLLLAPPAVVAAWVDDTATDTGRYVQTVAPLASDPAAQKVIADRLTDRVVADMDIEAVTASLSKALADAGAPPAVVDRSKALTGPGRRPRRSRPRRTRGARSHHGADGGGAQSRGAAPGGGGGRSGPCEPVSHDRADDGGRPAAARAEAPRHRSGHFTLPG